VGVVDLAEKIAGQTFWGNSMAGRSRQSHARSVVDYPQLERSVTALVKDGWLTAVTVEDARKLRLPTWGLVARGVYYLSTDDLAQAVAAHVAAGEAQRRSELMTAAQDHILASRRDEVIARYQELCKREGLVP
jgi:hypothetical protein